MAKKTMATQTIVIKLGTSTLTGGQNRLSRPHMVDIIRQIAKLHAQKHHIIMVSSGAMAAGRELLHYPDLPNHLPAKQMLCAVGQSYLMEVYSNLFGLYDLHIGQILLTHDDFAHRTRYLNARNTLTTLLDYGIIPIINENDTIAVDEIKVGDNDNLSARIAGLIDADWLLLLTDQEGLYESDPRSNPTARLIPEVKIIDETVWALAGGSGTTLGTGGMLTKIQAAQLATRSGTHTVITHGRTPDVILRLIAGEHMGTHFLPQVSHLEARKRWLLAEKPQGFLRIDGGACRALQNRGASLLHVGIKAIRGDFERGAVVLIEDENASPIAHGLTNYNSHELHKLQGQQSDAIIETLGYTYGDVAVHRDQLVLIRKQES